MMHQTSDLTALCHKLGSRVIRTDISQLINNGYESINHRRRVKYSRKPDFCLPRSKIIFSHIQHIQETPRKCFTLSNNPETSRSSQIARGYRNMPLPVQAMQRCLRNIRSFDMHHAPPNPHPARLACILHLSCRPRRSPSSASPCC
jgi:hypothetical protein